MRLRGADAELPGFLVDRTVCKVLVIRNLKERIGNRRGYHGFKTALPGERVVVVTERVDGLKDGAVEGVDKPLTVICSARHAAQCPTPVEEHVKAIGQGNTQVATVAEAPDRNDQVVFQRVVAELVIDQPAIVILVGQGGVQHVHQGTERHDLGKRGCHLLRVADGRIEDSHRALQGGVEEQVGRVQRHLQFPALGEVGSHVTCSLSRTIKGYASVPERLEQGKAHAVLDYGVVVFQKGKETPALPDEEILDGDNIALRALVRDFLQLRFEISDMAGQIVHRVEGVLTASVNEFLEYPSPFALAVLAERITNAHQGGEDVLRNLRSYPVHLILPYIIQGSRHVAREVGEHEFRVPRRVQVRQKTVHIRHATDKGILRCWRDGAIHGLCYAWIGKLHDNRPAIFLHDEILVTPGAIVFRHDLHHPA